MNSEDSFRDLFYTADKNNVLESYCGSELLKIVKGSNTVYDKEF